MIKENQKQKMSIIPEKILQELINDLNNFQPMSTMTKAKYIQLIQSKTKDYEEK